MTGTQENNRIAAAIMVCSFIGVLSFTQERGAGAVKNLVDGGGSKVMLRGLFW